MGKANKNTVDTEIETAVTRTDEDHVHDTVKIRLIREKIQVSELVGYAMAAVTVVLWVSGARPLLYLLIVAWLGFFAWWASLYWQLFRLKVKAERVEHIRQLVEDTSKKNKKYKAKAEEGAPQKVQPEDVLQKRTFDRKRFARVIRVDEETKVVGTRTKKNPDKSS